MGEDPRALGRRVVEPSATSSSGSCPRATTRLPNSRWHACAPSKPRPATDVERIPMAAGAAGTRERHEADVREVVAPERTVVLTQGVPKGSCSAPRASALTSTTTDGPTGCSRTWVAPSRRHARRVRGHPRDRRASCRSRGLEHQHTALPLDRPERVAPARRHVAGRGVDDIPTDGPRPLLDPPARLLAIAGTDVERTPAKPACKHRRGGRRVGQHRGDQRRVRPGEPRLRGRDPQRTRSSDSLPSTVRPGHREHLQLIATITTTDEHVALWGGSSQ